MYNILENLIKEKQKDDYISIKDLIKCYIKYINIIKKEYQEKREKYLNSKNIINIDNKDYLKNIKQEVERLLNENLFITDYGIISLYYSKYEIYNGNFFNQDINIDRIYLRKYNHRNLISIDLNTEYTINSNTKYTIKKFIFGDNIIYKEFIKKQEYEKMLYKNDGIINKSEKIYTDEDWNNGLINKFLKFNGILDAYEIYYLFYDYVDNIIHSYQSKLKKYKMYKEYFCNFPIDSIKEKLQDKIKEKLSEQKIYIKLKNSYNIEYILKLKVPFYRLKHIYDGSYSDEDMIFSIYDKDDNYLFGYNGKMFTYKNDRIFELQKEKYKILEKK